MPGIGTPHVWSEVIDFFNSAGTYYPASDIALRATPGDYLPMDPDKRGRTHHSGMFLAFDASQTRPWVWSLEGNRGNKVAVVNREFDDQTTLVPVNVGGALVWLADPPVHMGLGHIVSSLLP